MKMIPIIFVAPLFLIHSFGEVGVPSTATFIALKKESPAIRQVMERYSLSSLNDTQASEVLRLIENYGWGMRTVTVSIHSKASTIANVTVMLLRPGTSEVLCVEQEVALSVIANELEAIRKSDSYAQSKIVATPRVIDGETFLVESKAELVYRWFFRDGFGGNKFKGAEVLDAFAAIESRVKGAAGAQGSK